MQHHQRNESLDALRGISILAMVLSGSIAFGGVLPGWMYHAQVPPPLHKFIPTLPGITWVDLVFPFFLFSMGAAIPLALQKMAAKKSGISQVCLVAIRRYLLLVFFALFFQHMKPWSMAEHPGIQEFLVSLLAFMLLFFQLYQPIHRTLFWRLVKPAAYVFAILLLYLLPFKNGAGFSFQHSDIIIIVLGNMAFFGTVIWWITRHQPLYRLAILPLLMALQLGAKTPGSWNETLNNFSPLPWMYQFYYLKYLFIIIPGTFAGEWMTREAGAIQKRVTGTVTISGWLALSIIISSVILLYGRHLLPNLVVSLVLISLIYWTLYKDGPGNNLLKSFFCAGAFLLLLGLSFEAYEGGIKKDPSTYSYYLVSSGLAFFMLFFLSVVQQRPGLQRLLRYAGMTGKNPMVAYVAGALVVSPLLYLTQSQPWMDALNGQALAGFLKGIIFTALVAIITIVFTRNKLFWKT